MLPMLTFYEKLDKLFLNFKMLILKCYVKSINLFWLKQWMHLRINKYAYCIWRNIHMELKGNNNTATFTYIIYVYYLFIDFPVLHVVNPIYPPMAIISRDSEGVNSVQGFSSSCVTSCGNLYTFLCDRTCFVGRYSLISEKEMEI